VSERLEVAVPDIGDFSEVPVVEVLVRAGQSVAVDDPLVVLESDKASMEIPAPKAGTIAELRVAVGDTVSEGSIVAVLDLAPDGAGASNGAGDAASGAQVPNDAAVELPADAGAPGPVAEAAAGTAPAPAQPQDGAPPRAAPAAAAPGKARERGDEHAGVLVLGSGPGGYAAAFRAADLGLDVALVERHSTLGGVCLNVGCIPSKALLHVAKVIAETETLADHGVTFGKPKIDLAALRAWKEGVVGKLTGGLEGMAHGRKVRVLTGEGRFTGPNMLELKTANGTKSVSFDSAILAAGSSAVSLPGIPDDDPLVMDSTGALELEDVPKRLLVIGGGIIGLEMATVYDALGSKVTVVELLDQLIPGCDKDLVKPLQARIEKRYAAIHLNTKVENVEPRKTGLRVSFSGDVEPAIFDRILVAVGRRPNGAALGLDSAGVEVDERGFVAVDDKLRTSASHIHAIGDVVGQPMLAHKATHEGHVAAEVIAGHDVIYDVRAMPSVAYTEPEVAWVGLTETDAKEQGVAYEKTVFPWSASGRALALDSGSGLTKLLYDPKSRRVLGAGMVGTSAGDLAAEAALAIEMGAEVGDVALTVHPHPTLSETLMLAAELAEGTITDLPNPAVRRRSKA
jgi:dihydrolipoamide dehydrogenase